MNVSPIKRQLLSAVIKVEEQNNMEFHLSYPDLNIDMEHALDSKSFTVINEVLTRVLELIGE